MYTTYNVQEHTYKWSCADRKGVLYKIQISLKYIMKFIKLPKICLGPPPRQTQITGEPPLEKFGSKHKW